MSNSDTRIYRVEAKDGQEIAVIEIKGLATKEKEIVVSNVSTNDKFGDKYKEFLTNLETASPDDEKTFKGFCGFENY